MTPADLRALIQPSNKVPWHKRNEEALIALWARKDLLIELWELAIQHCETSIVSGSIAEDEMGPILKKLEES